MTEAKTTGLIEEPLDRADLRLVPPPPDDAENWTKLMNLLFLYEQDQLFVWARGVRRALQQQEEEASA